MKFDLSGENKPEYIVSSDTDSLFIMLGPILQKLYPDLDLNDVEEVLPKVRPLQKEIGEKLNQYQSTLAKKLLNSDEHYFDLKPEFIFKKAYWAGKRRYAQHIVDQEGIRKNDITMMGLDLMKSNFPPLFRDFGEKVIKDVLFSVSKSEIDKNILDFKQSLNTIDWKHLMKPTGLKKMDEYIESYPKNGEMFSRFKSRTPINTRSAALYNDFLRYYKLQVEYPEFNVGDKMYIAYLKNNPYKLDVIGLNGYNDPPQIIELINTYVDREGIFDSVFKNKIEGLYEDLNWQLVLNPFVDKFFTFN